MIDGLKPYPQMKYSGVPWLGEVPEHWEVRRLKQTFRRIIGGSTPSSTDATYWDGDIVWATPADVSKNSRLKGSQRRITSEGLAACSAELVPPGSIVVTSRAPVGNVAIADVALCTNQGCKVLVPPLRVLDPMFAFHVLTTLKGELQSLATGTTFTEISTSRMGNVRGPLPSLPEQAAIVRFLDHADRRIRRYIRAKQKLIKLLGEQKQAIIHRAVTCGLDPNVRLKSSGVEWLGNVPEHWEVVRLKNVASHIVDCLHATPTYTERGLFPAIRTADITPGAVHVRTARRVDDKTYERWTDRLEPAAGDILYSREGERFGIAACVPPDTRLCISQRMMVFRIRSEHDSSFVMWSLNSPQTYAQATQDVMGSTAPHVNVSTIRNFALALPSLDEQRKIVEHIECATPAIRRAIEDAVREVALLREYRTRLVADVVTGKLDVREAAARLPAEAEEPEPIEEAEAFGEAEVESAVDNLDPEPQEAEA